MARFLENKKEKMISEQVIVIAVVASLIAFFLYDFTEQDHQLSHTGLNSTATAFSGKLNVVRAQWFMDKQPNVVVVREFSHDGTSIPSYQGIPVNKQGWVDVSAKITVQNLPTNSPCELIWQYLIGGELSIINTPVMAIEINNSVKRSTRVCRYQTENGSHFEYDSENGKVSDVNFR